MGSVRVDINKRERQYDAQFPMHTPLGVEVFMENLTYIRGRRLKGDLDASLLLLDYEKVVHAAPLTRREREVIYWRYERELTEKEVANALGITVGSVAQFANRAITKIADVVAAQEGYKHADV